MERIDNFEIIETITETNKYCTYRSKKEGSNDTVLIKYLKTVSSSPSEIALFKQEYELIKTVDLDGVIKTYELLDHNGNCAIVFEDFNGIPLKNILHTKNTFNIRDFLEIAIKIATPLGELHRMDIIHRNIKPHSILVGPKTKTVKITNFGIDALLTHENDEIYNPDVIDGTLSYISPEQTGRMNSTVDYRTDLYSLGITFYEMLTGTAPFKSSDPMTIIHSHLAIKPDSPDRIISDIPEMISTIVLKLLSKSTDNRYQNAFGLAADLKECYEQLIESGKIKSFEPGQHDISNRFIFPQMLYGREDETVRLLSCFGNVSQATNQILLVSGEPGIGKSALINEIRNPIAAVRGYFISGKYEQFRRDIPYNALRESFQGMVNQILSENEESIRKWKERLTNALGNNGKIITDFIPDIEMIIGPQPDLEIIEPEEFRNRFNYTFEKFIAALATDKHPLALFLDDLQWADLASLTLIKNMILSDTIQHLMIIGSYRDNEVDKSHSLSQILSEIEKADIEISKITLGPLTEYDLKNLITDFLKCPEEKGAVLSNLVHRKTGGNPFFIKQFLHTLYDEKLLEIDPEHGWQWDMDRIIQMEVTNNVVELLSEKIKKLPGDTREIIQTGACIGHRFNLEDMSSITNIPIEKILPDLIDIVNDGYAYILGEVFIFLHDRIHEAAYSLVPEQDRATLHYRIGTLALEKAREKGNIENKLFYIVDQFNKATTLITGKKDREDLAGMNLEAGIKAMKSIAYSPAFHYLQKGISLLDENSWENQYQLTLALHTELAEACHFLGDFNTMNTLADVVIQNTKSVIDKVRIFEIRINALKAQRKYTEAMNTALPILKQLGLRFPRNPGKLRVAPTLIITMIRMFHRKPEKILEIPPSTDEKQLAITRILTSMGLAAFFTNQNIFALTVLKGINRVLSYGNVPDVHVALIAYAVILLSGLGDINSAYRIGTVVLKLTEASESLRVKSRIYFIYNLLIRHWKEPLINSLEPSMEGYRAGIESGDLEYAAWNLQAYTTVVPLSGMDLSEFEHTLAKHNKIIYDINQDSVGTPHKAVWQFTHCLLGRTDDPLQMKGEILDEDEIEAQWIREENSPALAVLYFLRMVLCFVFNEYTRALDISPHYKKYHGSLAGAPLDPYFYLMDTVARIWASPDISWFKRIKYRILARINRLRIKRWAKYSPRFKLQFYYAIEAVWTAKVKKNVWGAIEKVNLALKTAQDHNDLIIEAIANDIAMDYALSLDDDMLAKNKMSVSELDFYTRTYSANAYDCYRKWGAKGKLKLFREQYPDLVPAPENREPDATGRHTSLSSESSSDALDLSTILKASHTLSSEIMLENLLIKMIGIVIENAGADRGLMVLPDRERLLVEAEGSVDKDRITVLKSIPLESHKGISAPIVNFAARTKEVLLLNDVTTKGDFTTDPYILKNSPKSLLCFPLLNQGKLSGILYLENNHTTGAFTPERIEVLNILSTQVAISIDNAKLYENLEDKVRERTKDLQASNKQLEEAHRIAQIDMHMATNVQMSYLPEMAPDNPEWDIAFTFKPMSGVSGDFYDFYTEDGGLKGLALFDVSGHGIASGLITMIARSVFNRNFHNKKNEPLSEILNKSNRDLIKEKGNVDNYITGILLRFKGNRVEYVNAAHPQLICKRASTNSVDIINLENDDFRGIMLGIKDVDYSYEELDFDVSFGDTLLLYSDCLIEGRNDKEEPYRISRVLSSFANAPDTSAQEILDVIMLDFNNYVSAKNINDDLTVIVVKRKI